MPQAIIISLKAGSSKGNNVTLTATTKPSLYVYLGDEYDISYANYIRVLLMRRFIILIVRNIKFIIRQILFQKIMKVKLCRKLC